MYFVTGGTGFLGGQLCDALLARGDSVAMLVRPSSRLAGNSILNKSLSGVIIGDILDRDSLMAGMEGAEFCFHLAAMAKVWASRKDDFYRVNVEGTKNVLEAAVASGIQKLVFVSTAGIYGPSQNGADVIDESGKFERRQKTHYECSKYEAELLVKEFAAAGKLDATIVNPTRIFGPGALSDSNVVTTVLVRILQRQTQFLPSSNAVGNYVFVGDVVRGMLAAMASGQPGRNYILGGENTSWNELVQLMHDVTQQPNRVRLIPAALVNLIALLSELRAKILRWPPKITTAFVRKYKASYYLTSERAKVELGYSPVTLDEGLSRTVRWLENNSCAEPGDFQLRSDSFG